MVSGPTTAPMRLKLEVPRHHILHGSQVCLHTQRYQVLCCRCTQILCYLQIAVQLALEQWFTQNSFLHLQIPLNSFVRVWLIERIIWPVHVHQLAPQGPEDVRHKRILVNFSLQQLYLITESKQGQQYCKHTTTTNDQTPKLIEELTSHAPSLGPKV